MDRNKELAFGTEPSRYLYRLRLGHYRTAAKTTAEHVKQRFATNSAPMELLDVGVLEHLSNPDFALRKIGRVLRPDGLLVIGVPIHLPLIAFLCPYVLPVFDRISGVKQTYQQVFSYRSFIRLVRRAEVFSVKQIRGFRCASAGPFSLLEDFYWYYRLNQLVGKVLPWLCPEIQIIGIRRPCEQNY